MNERIKELKEQAWEYTMAVHDGLIVPPLDKEVWPVDKVFDEKFAELIVAECAKACEKNSYLALNGWQRAKQIREHFGVEE